MKKRPEKRPRSIPKPLRLTVRIDDPKWNASSGAPRLVRRAAALALAEVAAKGALTVLLSSDAHLRELNATFRGRKHATNVLSFPSDEKDYLGDVAIAHGVVAREAREQGKTFAAHAAHLAIHGILHLLGHDHEAEKDARAMEALETALLARLGIADPYEQRKAA
jgi:probable rRNA maturation factor